MGERQPNSYRIYNRREKASARKEGRLPNLLYRQPRVTPVSTEEAVKPLATPSTIIQSENRSLNEIVNMSPIEKDMKLPPRDVMGAGSALSMELTKFRPPPPDSADHRRGYISDEQVVRLLRELEKSIVANGIGNPSVIDEIRGKLKGIIGPLGSLSTEIDMASFGILRALRLAEQAGGIVKETETTK